RARAAGPRPDRGDQSYASAARGVGAMRLPPPRARAHAAPPTPARGGERAGAANVADRYAAQIGAEPELELAGATDLDGARAEALVAEHGGRAYADLDAVLADDGVDTVVQLHVAREHFVLVY